MFDGLPVLAFKLNRFLFIVYRFHAITFTYKFEIPGDLILVEEDEWGEEMSKFIE